MHAPALAVVSLIGCLLRLLMIEEKDEKEIHDRTWRRSSAVVVKSIAFELNLLMQEADYGV